MLIDPQGLLRGDRVRACSDDAQLHFPRLLAASNSFGRFRMSVEWLVSEVYGSFTHKPGKEQLTAWLREYHANFLLFVYRAPDGSTWAQWEIPEKLLGKYRYEADKKTPAPPAREHEAFRAAYLEMLRLRNKTADDLGGEFQNLPESLGAFRNFPKSFGTLQNVPQASAELQNIPEHVLVGVGVGVGVGAYEVLASDEPTPHTSTPPSKAPNVPRPEPHPLFGDCRAALIAYWHKYVQPNVEPTWDGSESKALSDLLRALPSLSVERFRRMLEHRGQSDANPCERPRRWIASLPDYELGPLDAFGKPKVRRVAPGAGVGMPGAAPGATATKALLAKQDEDALNYWREIRERGSPRYAAECPAWARRRIETETETEQAVA